MFKGSIYAIDNSTTFLKNQIKNPEIARKLLESKKEREEVMHKYQEKILNQIEKELESFGFIKDSYNVIKVNVNKIEE